MLYALVALGVVVISEAGALWYLWSRLRSSQDDAAVAGALSTGLQVQLTGVYTDLALARQMLAKQNEVENKADAAVVEASPELDDAITRINSL